jgi:carbon-monoxide dehydrogenase iron sulfur subunit
VSRYVAVDSAVCTGCRECEVVCSLAHLGECRPGGSAVRVARRERDGLVDSLPRVCQQCEPAYCVQACPTEALTRTNGGSWVAVDSGLCSGCGECTAACPAGCIFLDDVRQIAVCCDLCGGSPECVEFCHSKCLTLAETESPGARGRLERLVATAQAIGATERGDR